MNAPSYDIVEMIESYGESSGIDLTYGTNLFIGKEPATPKECVTVFDYGGFPPELTFDGASGYEFPSVQIRLRGTKYTTGWNLINSIKDALHGQSHTTVNSTLYTVINCSSGPALLDWDDNGLPRFVCSFNIQRRAV